MPLTPELASLVGASLLLLAFGLAHSLVNISTLGLAGTLGNRDTAVDQGALAGRLNRAQANLLAALASFAPLVLIATLLDRHTALTALSAEVFLAARVAHAVSYAAGITVVRSAAFYAGFGATLVLALQLL